MIALFFAYDGNPPHCSHSIPFCAMFTFDWFALVRVQVWEHFDNSSFKTWECQNCATRPRAWIHNTMLQWKCYRLWETLRNSRQSHVCEAFPIVTLFPKVTAKSCLKVLLRHRNHFGTHSIDLVSNCSYGQCSWLSRLTMESCNHHNWCETRSDCQYVSDIWSRDPRLTMVLCGAAVDLQI